MVARADMESAPTMNRTLGNNAKSPGASGTPPPTIYAKGCNHGGVLWRGQDPSLQHQWARERRGAQCAPVQIDVTQDPTVLKAPLEGSSRRQAGEGWLL